MTTGPDTTPEVAPPPRANPELVGHPAAERTLIEACRSGHLAHAWLITGPKGIGKATLAFRFARFVLTAGGGARPFEGAPESLRVDPDHPVFRRVAAGGHADLFTVERGYDEKRERLRTEIIVGNVRDVGAFLHLTPAEGGWRVVVVDSADEMNRNAANALLKVLEEPPRQVLILMVSHNPGRLLPTIRSRCRKLPLRPLDEAEVAGILARARPDLTAEDVRTLVRLAEGSAGRAVDLAAQGGLDLYRELVGLVEGLPQLDVGALHALADRLGRAGAETAYHTLTGLLSWWLARLILSGGAGELGGRPGEIVPGEDAVMARLLGYRGLDQWLGVWEKITGLFAQAESANLDRKQVVLNAFVTLGRAAGP